MLEAAVFGVPSEEWGESVHAVVVVREGATMTEERGDRPLPRAPRRLQDPAVGHLEPDELPKTGSGKILKRELRAPFWAGRASKV